MPKPLTTVGAKLKIKIKAHQPPVWDGPASDSPQGGVTQSLINNYLSCKERFRISVMDGLRPYDAFNKYFFFGDLWHLAEEIFAGGGDWQTAITKKAQEVLPQYPLANAEITKWYNVVKTAFPVYVKFWEKQKDQVNSEPLLQEHAFHVSYKLPSGRIACLRGKWDKVDLVKSGKTGKIWLTDHKTKSEVNEPFLRKQLTFDLQIMTYLAALKQFNWTTVFDVVNDEKCPLNIFKSGSTEIGGFFYNVIRKPLSGGKGSIVQHKPTKSNPQGETTAEYYARLRGIIEEAPETYFFRWKVDITSAEIELFEKTFLYPVLENMLDDYEWWSYAAGNGRNGDTRPFSPFDYTLRQKMFPEHRNRHFRLPYGIWNTIADGGATDLDEYLLTGQTAGLERVKTLFPELE